MTYEELLRRIGLIENPLWLYLNIDDCLLSPSEQIKQALDELLALRQAVTAEMEQRAKAMEPS